MFLSFLSYDGDQTIIYNKQFLHLSGFSVPVLRVVIIPGQSFVNMFELLPQDMLLGCQVYLIKRKKKKQLCNIPAMHELENVYSSQLKESVQINTSYELNAHNVDTYFECLGSAEELGCESLGWPSTGAANRKLRHIPVSFYVSSTQ